MKVYLYILFIAIGLAGCNSFESEDEPNLVGSIPVLQIETNPDDYLSLLENKTTDFEIPCNIIYKNNLYKGKIAAAGAGSRYHDKWGYKVVLEPNNFIEGLYKFNLSSQIYDKTSLSTAIALKYYQKLGFPVHKLAYVFVKINGVDKGLYPLVERVEEQFFINRAISVNELFKLGFETKFTFNNVYIPEYNLEKKIPDDNNYNSINLLINALDTCNLSITTAGLNKFLDINNYIKYHAFTTIINNQDAFTNNFFLIKQKPNEPFTVIPWDFDKAFIGDVGLYGENDIIAKLKGTEFTKQMYLNEITYQLNNVFNETELFNFIDSLAIVIKPAYNRDPFLGKNRYNFDVEINNLKTYIINRRQNLLNKIISGN
ncbi:MAG: CotH kinase family protein [bacterium]